tara:strand:- start:7 stop:1125 length:1119 start_codon:yes stop_codon:yes gene_type:complete
MSSNSFTEAQLAFMSSNSFTEAQIAAITTLFGNPSSTLSETPIGDELSHGQQCFDADEVFFTPEQESEVLELMDQEENEALLAAAFFQRAVATEPLVEETLPKKRGAPKGPRTAPAPECRCMARVWGDGTGAQCMSRRKTEHGEFCATHGKAVAITCQPCEFSEDGKKTGLFLGRIDQARPTHNAEGERCVIWDDEDQSIVPNEANPATFRGEMGGGWSLHSSEGKKAATLLKRWNAKTAKADKDAAKVANKLLKASAKKTEMAKKEATKVAEKAQKSATKKAEKAQKSAAKKLLKKTLPKKPKAPSAFFNWLNAPGTRDVITAHLAKMPARTTVVRQSEVTSMAGQMWKLLADDAKAQWKTTPATEAQAAE